MVVLSASVLTRSGKVLVARQFVEITRMRLEGLLTAFPKLLSSGSREHTYIDTDSVRYVYQPLESLFVLLVTNKTSNIVEDLHTIQLLAKLVPDVCDAPTEAAVREKQFELIFAIDEALCAGGHAEHVSLQQIRTNLEMESHEEKLHEMILESKRAAAKDDMKRHSARIRKEEQERARMERAGLSTGFNPNSISSASSMGSAPSFGGIEPSFGGATMPTSPPSYTPAPEPPIKSTGGMKLGGGGGTSKANGSSFLDAMAAEDGLQDLPPVSTAVEAPKAPEVQTSSDPVNAVVEEKMTVLLNREGALEQLEIKGNLFVTANDPEQAKSRLQLKCSPAPGVTFQTHPKVDKKLFDKESTLGLKDATKPLPSKRVALLRWSQKSQDESLLPLNITCWPEEEGNGKMNVNIEYSMERDMVLENVMIVVPLGTHDAPSVDAVDGQYQHNANDGTLVWHQDQIDSSNNTGTLEFSIRGNNMDAFFPLAVSFFSRSLYSDVDVVSVSTIEDKTPVQFGFDKLLTTDVYQIV